MESYDNHGISTKQFQNFFFKDDDKFVDKQRRGPGTN
jgi:hypothetical protein